MCTVQHLNKANGLISALTVKHNAHLNKNITIYKPTESAVHKYKFIEIWFQI